MLLQTFVQLNILLMAAPALAGWAALPVTPPMLAQAAQIAFLPILRQAQESPQAAKEQRTPQPKSSLHRVSSMRSPVVSQYPENSAAVDFSAQISRVIPPFNSFPHAARAP